MEHIPYEQRFNRREDFRVKYELNDIAIKNGLATIKQGIRCNFWYECNTHEPPYQKKENSFRGQFMIFPEFEDNSRKVIENAPIPLVGTAKMWIAMDYMIPYHKGRIHLGTKGYFLSANHILATCNVIEIVNLGTKS